MNGAWHEPKEKKQVVGFCLSPCNMIRPNKSSRRVQLRRLRGTSLGRATSPCSNSSRQFKRVRGRGQNDLADLAPILRDDPLVTPWLQVPPRPILLLIIRLLFSQRSNALNNSDKAPQRIENTTQCSVWPTPLFPISISYTTGTASLS